MEMTLGIALGILYVTGFISAIVYFMIYSIRNTYYQSNEREDIALISLIVGLLWPATIIIMLLNRLFLFLEKYFKN